MKAPRVLAQISFDNGSAAISDPSMHAERPTAIGKSPRRNSFHALAVALSASLALSATGCTLTLSPLARQTAAFATATGTVVDNSEAAYRAANQLHHQEQVAAAIDAYDTQPGWRPDQAVKPLLTPDQLAARTKVLDALKAYAQGLAALTETKNRNTKLEGAATTVGSNLMSLTAAGAPDLKHLFPSITGLSQAEANGVSTAIVGLGELLMNAKSKKALAATARDMEPKIDALCLLISHDADILRTQADVDYQGPITSANQFIQHTKLDPLARRAEIAKLIALAEQQQANDALLAELQDAVGALAKAHTALADAAEGKDPETLKKRIAELTTLGSDLGTYYSSLPAS